MSVMEMKKALLFYVRYLSLVY